MLTLAAADNYRIAVKTVQIARPVAGDEHRGPGPLAERAHARSWPTSTTRSTSSLAPSKNQVLFHLEGIDLVSRLIDGQFPNYEQVMPKATRPGP